MFKRRLHGTKTQNLKQFTALHTDSIVHPSLKTQLRLWLPNSDFYSQNIYRGISFGLAYICIDIVQFAQHLDITDSQLQKLIDHLHLIHRTSGSTLSGSHNNLASASRHQIIHCWLASSATENWSANQQQNCTSSLSFSFLLLFTQTTPPFLFCLLCPFWIPPYSSLDPPPSLLAFSFTLQTAIFHNLSTDLSHNSELPFSLHTHSVQPSCKSLSTTPHSQTSKASHAEVK